MSPGDAHLQRPRADADADAQRSLQLRGPPSMPAATRSGACSVNDRAVHSRHGRARLSR